MKKFLFILVFVFLIILLNSVSATSCENRKEITSSCECNGQAFNSGYCCYYSVYLSANIVHQAGKCGYTEVSPHYESVLTFTAGNIYFTGGSERKNNPPGTTLPGSYIGPEWAVLAKQYDFIFNGIDSSSYSSIKLVNPSIKTAFYTAVNEVYCVLETQQFCENYNLMQQKAAQDGINFEDLFLHFRKNTNITFAGETRTIPGWNPADDQGQCSGTPNDGINDVINSCNLPPTDPNATAKTKFFSRVPSIYGSWKNNSTSPFYPQSWSWMPNSKNTKYSQYNKEIVLQSIQNYSQNNINVDGVFIDNMGRSPYGGGNINFLENNNTFEVANTDDWFNGISQVLGDETQSLNAIGKKTYINPGTAEYWFEPFAYTANGFFREWLIKAKTTNSNTEARFLNNLVPQINLTKSLGKEHFANFTLETFWDEGNLGQCFDGYTMQREQMWSLATYYLLKYNGLYFWPGFKSWSGYWFGALSVDIGNPTGDWYAWKQNLVDSLGRTYKIYKRDYTKGIALVRFWEGGNCPNATGMQATSIVPLDQVDIDRGLKFVNVDGTIGGTATSVSLKIADGIILVAGEETFCDENWDCSVWSSCVNGIQNRTCTDLNSCGTTTEKPAETQSCHVSGIPPTITVTQENPITSKTFEQGKPFTYTTKVTCNNSDCGNITVTLDPILGNNETTCCNYYPSVSPGEKAGSRFKMPNERGKLQSLTAYVYLYTGRTFYAAVYEDNAGIPGTKIAEAQNTIRQDGSAKQITFNFNNEILEPNKYYWLVIGVDGNGGTRLYGKEGLAKQTAYGTGIPFGSNLFGEVLQYTDITKHIFVEYTLDEDSKGVIPMNSGTPFYTTSQNPQTCLNIKAGQTCTNTWTVMPTGEIGKTYSFFVDYLPQDSNIDSKTTQTINITIGEQGSSCDENWSCISWSSCINGNQTRTCTDLNSCGTPDYNETQACGNCINETTQNCTTNNCLGTQTCSNNLWGSCIDTPNDNCPNTGDPTTPLKDFNVLIEPENLIEGQDFTITVTFENTPIQNAKIAYANKTYYTNSQGKTTIKTQTEHKTLTASKTGYNTKTVNLNIQTFECGNGLCETEENTTNCPTDCKITTPKKMNITVTEKNNQIEVKVIDSEGKPIADAQVSYGTETKNTNTQGITSFNQQPQEQKITAAKQGYETISLNYYPDTKCITGTKQNCSTTENCQGTQLCVNGNWNTCIDTPGDQCPTTETDSGITAVLAAILIIGIILMVITKMKAG